MGGAAAARGEWLLGDADCASGDGDDTGTAEDDTGDGGGGGFPATAAVPTPPEGEKSNRFEESSLAAGRWCSGTSTSDSSPGIGLDCRIGESGHSVFCAMVAFSFLPLWLPN